MSIVTVSHEIGAGGPEIGQKVAERLGLHYVDQELISDAALRYGVLEEKLSSLDESKPSGRLVMKCSKSVCRCSNRCLVVCDTQAIKSIVMSAVGP